MLIHPWDSGDAAETLDFVRAQGFGQLIAAGRGRDIPVVVPTQYHLADSRTVLLHLARPNPVWHAIEENPAVLLSVAGDWCYIPSEWNGEPTTYYAAAQLHCTATMLDGAEAKKDILRRQMAPLEDGSKDYDLDGRSRMLPGLRALRLAVVSCRGKFKYGGKADVSHRLDIAGRLADRDRPGDAAARRHLLRRLPEP